MKSEELRRKERLKKAEKLKGTWDLMINCKEFLEEWEGSWVEGSEKSRIRQENTRKEIEKCERFEKIEIRKKEIKKKMLQTRLNLGVKELGKEGMKEWSETIKHERQELQELKENLWRWRDSGGGKTKNGKERMREPNEKTTEKKLKSLEEILERERKEKEKVKDLKEKETSRLIQEVEKRKIRLEMKRILEQKWQTVRWVVKHLDENEKELTEMLEDTKEAEDEELKKWAKMKRIEKIEKIRKEKNFTETRPKKLDSAWELKLKNKSTTKENSTTPKKVNINEKKINSALMPVGGEEGGGDSKLSPTPRETTLQNILRRKKENNEFLPPPKQFPEIIPSWSGTRMKRKFLRKMDKVFHEINFLGMIEEELQYPEYLLPPPEIGEYSHVERLFGGTERDTPTDTDTTDLPTDFDFSCEMTTEFTESLLEEKNCFLVLESVENVDLKVGQLCDESLGQLAGGNLLTGAVPKRNQNTSAVPKRKTSMKIKSGINKVWNAGETVNMSKSLTLSKSMRLGLGVIGVTSDLDCVTNIYLRSSKLSRTSGMEMEPDGVTMTVGECKDAVLGIRPIRSVMSCGDEPVVKTKPNETTEIADMPSVVTGNADMPSVVTGNADMLGGTSESADMPGVGSELDDGPVDTAQNVDRAEEAREADGRTDQIRLMTNVRGHAAVNVEDQGLGMRMNVGTCDARETSSTNVRGTWLSRVGGSPKPGTGTRRSSPSALRRTSRRMTSTSISKSRRTTTLWGRGTSSPSGTQRRAVSNTTSGVQSLISWANQLGKLGKQTKLTAKPVLSNGMAQTASQESDSVDSLPGQASVGRCTNERRNETRN